MLQPGGELDLPVKALPVNPGGHVRRQDFDDDSPVQFYFQREKYTAHAAATQFLDEAVVVTDGCLKAIEEFGQEVLGAGDCITIPVEGGGGQRNAAIMDGLFSASAGRLMCVDLTGR